jgi:hypothetical protein
MKRIFFLSIMLTLLALPGILRAQDPDDSKTELSGELFADERFLVGSQNDWSWNETRLLLNLDRRISGKSRFHSEIWLRNIGLPDIVTSSDLYNKGIIDPYNLEIREAYIHLYGFLTKNLDLRIGRQRIAWGTADRLNPTDNLNPYDMEDILDFGRHRGSDAVNLQYYFNDNFSLQGVFIPFFRPANMPVGIFSDALNPGMALPPGMTLKGFSDTLLMPRYNISQSSASGLKFKGYAGGVDFSISYVWGMDGLPVSTRNTFFPVDTEGGINIKSQLSFARTHIIGADLATSLAGIGLWAEAALFVPDCDMVMINDLSALYPQSPVPVIQDSLILDRTEPWLKFIVGGDYFFADGSYFNIQFMHGFVHERGGSSLNDYFFLRYEKNFFHDRLKIAPLGGGFIVTDWSRIRENYALIYMPEISFQATGNTVITLSTVLFEGRGESLFASLNDYNMFMFKLKYSF